MESVNQSSCQTQVSQAACSGQWLTQLQGVKSAFLGKAEENLFMQQSYETVVQLCEPSLNLVKWRYNLILGLEEKDGSLTSNVREENFLASSLGYCCFM